MGRQVKTLTDVVSWRMCVGCGACASICPKENVSLIHVTSEGVRPVLLNADGCGTCQACLDVCPGLAVDYSEHRSRPEILRELLPSHGPVLQIWEGHAADPDVRFQGSSGGALTALALFCIESQAAEGVVHIGQDPADPLKNKTFLSKTRAELISRTGSRYAPASACDALRDVEQLAGQAVFIGQPSEVAALRKAERIRPQLSSKIAVRLSFFCAGSPSAQGTIDLIKKHGIKPEDVTHVRYRGRGWPGNFTVHVKGTQDPVIEMTYKDSWRFVQAYRPWAVHLWPDGSGEEADISCGDPWYRPVTEGEVGSSLIVVRTTRGAEILKRAVEAGYLVARPAEPRHLIDSQQNLVMKKGAVWGRIATSRLFLVPTPKYRNVGSFRSWLTLDLAEKAKSVVGTARRILSRRYFRRQQDLKAEDFNMRPINNREAQAVSQG
jgi:coenzyme F420 hydrogenase subunit beta